MAALVELTKASVSFAGVRALVDVDLSVRSGELLAVIGPNGAGKTTLLNSISGLVRYSAGLTKLEGHDITSIGAVGRARRGIGRSFQAPQLINSASVMDNLMLGVHIPLQRTWLSRQKRRAVELEARARAAECLSMVGLGDMTLATVGDLPYSAHKMVDLIRVLVGTPVLILVDEPTSGLDSESRDLIGRLIRFAVDKRFMAAIVVEHHMEFVRDYADRVLVLEAGKVLMHGQPNEVLSSGTLSDAVLGGRIADPQENIIAAERCRAAKTE